MTCGIMLNILKPTKIVAFCYICWSEKTAGIIHTDENRSIIYREPGVQDVLRNKRDVESHDTAWSIQCYAQATNKQEFN